jgi:PAS domain S-box-containing protein
MTVPESQPLLELDEDAALRTILEGTATATGERFFTALVQSLVRALRTHGAWVTEFVPEARRLRALAFYMDGQWVTDYEFDITGTPCEAVIDRACLIHFPDRLIELFPHDPDIARSGVVSYLGMPLLDVDGTILGHMAVVDRRPMPAEPRLVALFRIFAERAAAELRRLRAERQLREREEKLSRLVDSAMDAIIELDQQGQVSMLNAAAEKVLGCPAGAVIGQDFARFLCQESARKVAGLVADLDRRPVGQRYLWIPGGLEAKRADGSTFSAEATLSRYEMGRRAYHTLILRDVHDRLEAEERIQSLTVEAEYLREELEAAHNFGEIVGRSRPLLRVLRDLRQVAATDATVLILGETGTGKELIARALHAASGRRDKPLIKVNCAALPANLIESELFGHEKGAFTGATAKRVGRFTLADGGTLFLDEVGELPLDLQAKLLRVLQEGEFEPVGSAHTHKVNVRVLAATNRDLDQARKSGTFREDLYYRLNVFPIRVPPLRERGDDVVLLAAACARRFAERLGRRLEPLTDADRRRLKAYPWPGNVRELQNVIERAVITARDGRLNLEQALPEAFHGATATGAGGAAGTEEAIYTIREMEQLERANLVRALEACNWKVAGPQGAARRLGMKSSTLSSRMKALGVKRPPKA